MGELEMSTMITAGETLISSETISSSSSDPYAWDTTSGLPADSPAMMKALREDSKKMAEALNEPEILKLLQDDDVSGFSALAQRCFQVIMMKAFLTLAMHGAQCALHRMNEIHACTRTSVFRNRIPEK